MKWFIPLRVILTCCLFYACSDDNPTKPGLPCDDITVCDTCNTYDELPMLGDSAAHNYPVADITIMGLSKAPFGDLYAAGSFLDIGLNKTYVFKLGAVTPDFVQSGTWAEWSNDGKKLLHALGIYDVETKSIQYFIQEGVEYPVWSLSNGWILFNKNNSAFRMRADGTELTFICDSMGVTRQANDSILVSFYDDVLCTYNLNNQTYQVLEFSRLPANLELMTKVPSLFIRTDAGCWDVSPDGTKILADFNDTRGVLYRENRGLYLFDLENESVTMVLPGQYWGQPYYPRWASNNSFYASYFCRKDRLSMVYEFGLDGKTKKQMTFVTQKFW